MAGDSVDAASIAAASVPWESGRIRAHAAQTEPPQKRSPTSANAARTTELRLRFDWFFWGKEALRTVTPAFDLTEIGLPAPRLGPRGARGVVAV